VLAWRESIGGNPITVDERNLFDKTQWLAASRRKALAFQLGLCTYINIRPPSLVARASRTSHLALLSCLWSENQKVMSSLLIDVEADVQTLQTPNPFGISKECDSRKMKDRRS